MGRSDREMAGERSDGRDIIARAGLQSCNSLFHEPTVTPIVGRGSNSATRAAVRWFSASARELSPATRATTLELIFAIGVVCVIVLLSWWRLRFGLNLADEAYYIAIPLRFVRHDVPFDDEVTTLFSMFAFVTYPLYKVRTLFVSSTDGIVMYSRCAYLIVQCAVGAAAYMGIRRFVTSAEALLIACVVVAFVPFNIPALSYNTLAENGLIVGLLAVALGVNADRQVLVACAGFVLALSVAVYPTLLPVWSLVLVGLIVAKRRFAVQFLLGSLAAVVVLAPFLIHANIDNIRRSIVYYRSTGHHDPIVRKAVTQTLLMLKEMWPSAVLCGGSFVLVRRWPAIASRVVFVGLPIALYFANGTAATDVLAAHQFVVAISLTGVFVFRYLPATAQMFMAFVWVPSALAAIIMATSSSNGSVNAGIGAAAAAMVSLTMLLALLRGPSTSRSVLGRWGRLSFVALTLGVLVHYQYSSVYWESALRDLGTAVVGGPYDGIRTTATRAQYVSQLRDDLAGCCPKNEPIVFYHDFPGGYLFSEAKAATNAVWLFSPSEYPGLSTAALAAYFKNDRRVPGVVVKMRKVPWGQYLKDVRYVSTHPVDELLASGAYRKTIDRDEYEIWLK